MDIFAESHNVLRENRRQTDGHQYTLPSPDSYPYQWLWDSCFHAIVLAKLEPDFSKNELRALVSRQFNDGMIPHMIYWQNGELYNYKWGKAGTSAISQPPMIAMAVERIYKNTKDKAFLEEIYPALWNFYKYFIDKRDQRQHNFISIINPDESGEDNSPRFDEVLRIGSNISLEDHLKKRMELIEANVKCNFDAEECMKNHFWVKDVPFNSIFVANMECLARLAAELEKEGDVAYIHEEARVVKEAMRTFMFEDGLYWSTYGNNYKKLKVATWAHFVPMFAGLYSQEEAENVVRSHLLNLETFRSPFGIRTVSKQEPSYQASASSFSWRGPIWFAPHWFIYKGLIRYGFTEEAKWIRDKSTALLEKGGFREYYNPETGEGMGAKNFTWGTLVTDMTEE